MVSAFINFKSNGQRWHDEWHQWFFSVLWPQGRRRPKPFLKRVTPLGLPAQCLFRSVALKGDYLHTFIRTFRPIIGPRGEVCRTEHHSADAPQVFRGVPL